MKKLSLKVGDFVKARKNGEIVPGVVIHKDTYKAEIAFEQTLNCVEDYFKTVGITYKNILALI